MPTFDFFGDDVLGPSGVEVVGYFVARGHFGEGVIHNAIVGTSEDGLLRFQIIEPGPINFSRSGIGHVVRLAGCVLDLLHAYHAMLVQPIDASLHALPGCIIQRTDAHQHFQHIRPLSSTERGWFFLSRRRRFKSDRIVLRAPQRRLAINFELHIHQTFETSCKRLTYRRTPRFIYETPFGVLGNGDGVQCFESM